MKTFSSSLVACIIICCNWFIYDSVAREYNRRQDTPCFLVELYSARNSSRWSWSCTKISCCSSVLSSSLQKTLEIRSGAVATYIKRHYCISFFSSSSSLVKNCSNLVKSSAYDCGPTSSCPLCMVVSSLEQRNHLHNKEIVLDNERRNRTINIRWRIAHNCLLLKNKKKFTNDVKKH